MLPPICNYNNAAKIKRIPRPFFYLAVGGVSSGPTPRGRLVFKGGRTDNAAVAELQARVLWDRGAERLPPQFHQSKNSARLRSKRNATQCGFNLPFMMSKRDKSSFHMFKGYLCIFFYEQRFCCSFSNFLKLSNSPILRASLSSLKPSSYIQWALPCGSSPAPVLAQPAHTPATSSSQTASPEKEESLERKRHP